MNTKEALLTTTVTSPAAASTVISTIWRGGMANSQADALLIDAALLGATGGTLNVYLQRKIAADTWRDWISFPQLAAGAAAIKYTLFVNGNQPTMVVVGGGTDAAATPVLAANSFVNTIPFGDIRVVFVAGASTSAGAAQTIQIQPITSSL